MAAPVRCQPQGVRVGAAAAGAPPEVGALIHLSARHPGRPQLPHAWLGLQVKSPLVVAKPGLLPTEGAPPDASHSARLGYLSILIGLLRHVQH